MHHRLAYFKKNILRYRSGLYQLKIGLAILCQRLYFAIIYSIAPYLGVR